MSSRILWVISLPAAVIGWMALLLTTGAMSPSSAVAWAIVAVLLALAVTMTAAPFVWVIAHRLRLPGAGTSPAVALRIAMWIGLWAAVVLSLRLARAFDWVVVLTLAAVLGLAETFLQQVERPHGTNGRRTTDDERRRR